jgi:phenylacetate-CoA ligase
MEVLAGEVDKLTWPLERLWELRDRRLRDLVRHAKEHSPWHARRLADIEPDDVTAETLRNLPTMGKPDLMGEWNAISTDRRLTLEVAQAALDAMPESGTQWVLDDYLVMSTSGSSGVPTVVAWDRAGWEDMAAVVMRAGLWLQQHASGGGAASGPPPAPFTQVAIASPRPTSMSHQLGAFLANPMVISHDVPARTPLPEMVARLNELAPQGIFGYSSVLAMLGGEAAAGRLTIRPAMVGASSEPLLPPMAHLIRRGLGVEPSNTFAVTEIGALAARTFPGAPGLCLAEDVAVYEVDDDGALVVTNVLNKALPLIRYRLGDRVRIRDADDDVPWTGRRIEITDTSGVVFAFGDGVEVPASRIADALAAAPTVVDYAVRQTPGGVAVAVWAPDGLDPGPLEHALAAVLGQAGEVELSVLDDPSALPQTAAGKRHRFIAAG